MAEYIEREKAYEKCGWYNTVNGKSICAARKDELAAIPAADVAPVVHSHWEYKITDDGENIGICHNCKYPVSWFWEQAKYCPNCGAKMEVDHEDD